MTITIAPFMFDPVTNSAVETVGQRGKAGIKNPITYWGIYMDDKYVSYTSSKELAEKTKAWMEKWLERKR